MNNDKFNIAVLIDGDNAQSKLIKELFEEVSKYGKATIRRIYGDWTTPQMTSWKDIINQYSINPIQKFSYTTGKNSTDSSLIIDAMDILHSKSFDPRTYGFKTLTQLFESLDKYVVVKNEVNGLNHPLVKLK